MWNQKYFIGLGLFIFFIILSHSVFAESKLVWNASSGVVTGYRIYFGPSVGNYPDFKEVGNVTEYPLSGLPLQERNSYFIIARAYNSAGESGDSNYVPWKVPDRTSPAPVQGVSVN